MTPEVSGSEAGVAREAAGGTSLLLSAVAGGVLGAGGAGRLGTITHWRCPAAYGPWMRSGRVPVQERASGGREVGVT